MPIINERRPSQVSVQQLRGYNAPDYSKDLAMFMDAVNKPMQNKVNQAEALYNLAADYQAKQDAAVKSIMDMRSKEQEYDYKEEVNPLLIEQQRLVNSAKVLQNSLDQKTMPYKISNEKYKSKFSQTKADKAQSEYERLKKLWGRQDNALGKFKDTFNMTPEYYQLQKAMNNEKDNKLIELVNKLHSNPNQTATTSTTGTSTKQTTTGNEVPTKPNIKLPMNGFVLDKNTIKQEGREYNDISHFPDNERFNVYKNPDGSYLVTAGELSRNATDREKKLFNFNDKLRIKTLTKKDLPKFFEENNMQGNIIDLNNKRNGSVNIQNSYAYNKAINEYSKVDIRNNQFKDFVKRAKNTGKYIQDTIKDLKGNQLYIGTTAGALMDKKIWGKLQAPNKYSKEALKAFMDLVLVYDKVGDSSIFQHKVNKYKDTFRHILTKENYTHGMKNIVSSIKIAKDDFYNAKGNETPIGAYTGREILPKDTPLGEFTSESFDKAYKHKIKNKYIPTIDSREVLERVKDRLTKINPKLNTNFEQFYGIGNISIKDIENLGEEIYMQGDTRVFLTPQEIEKLPSSVRMEILQDFALLQSKPDFKDGIDFLNELYTVEP
ncbi:MAG: hypothetical protein KGV46_01610 [Pasteurella sp.]|nr:hypothetical protein [Pasteurella sp.]